MPLSRWVLRYRPVRIAVAAECKAAGHKPVEPVAVGPVAAVGVVVEPLEVGVFAVLPEAVPLPSDFRMMYRTSRHPPLVFHILYSMP